MKTFITYLLVMLSILSYGQCDIYDLGGRYEHPNTYSEIKDIEVYVTTDYNDYIIVVFDFYGKDDTVLVNSTINHGRLVNHYKIESSFFESKTYKIKKIIYDSKCNYLLKISKNNDMVKWVEFHDGGVCIIHKHNLFTKCGITFKKEKK